jgi:hypothetical protein
VLVRAIAMLTGALPLISANGQSTTTSPNASVEYAPRVHFDLPGPTYVAGLALSNDGSRLYIRLPGRAINVAALGLHFWPEWFGALAGAAAIALALVWRRVASTPRLAGEPHCRKCNYCLKNCPAERCPECGAPVLRPIIGQRPIRRLLPIAIPAAAIILAYAALWIARVPRDRGDTLHWNCWSYELEATALRYGVSLKQFAVPVDVIKEFESRSGKFLRNLVTDYGAPTPWCRIIATPDGKGLLASLSSGAALVLIDRATGRTIASMSLADLGHSPGSRWDDITGFGTSDGSVYAVAFDPTRECTELVRWIPGASRVERLVRSGADEADLRGTKTPWPRRFSCLPGVDPRYLVEATASVAVPRDSSETSFWVRRVTEPDTILAQAKFSAWGFSNPISLADGENFLLGTKNESSGGLCNVCTATCSSVGQVSVLSHFVSGMHSASIPCAARLAVEAHNAWKSANSVSIAVLDSRDGATIDIFPLPDGTMLGQYVELAAEGGWLAASVFRRDPTAANAFIQSIVVYELPTVARP